MKNFTSHKLFLTGLICLLSISYFNAQVMLKEISLEQQINTSTSVVEGEVISKTSHWNTEYTSIYTINTIKVFKVFKGQDYASTIEVVTPGGTVNGMSQITRPSLQLRKNDIGIFTLNGASTKILCDKTHSKLYKPCSSVQSFYKYDLLKNVAINPFSKKINIESSFYDEIISHTKTNIKEVSKFNVTLESAAAKASQSKALLAPSNINFSPSEISAGTASELIITGTDFGTIKGKVAFKSSEDGGVGYIDALNSQVTWSPTQITVEVPSFAGTGTVRVTDDNGDFSESSNELTIIYALTNQTSNGFEYPIQAYGVNGSGGFTWQKNSGFTANTDADAAFSRALDSWRCETGVNWVIGDDTSTPTAALDSKNVVSFEALPAGNLGITSTYIGSCNNSTDWFVEEIDIIFDNTISSPWNYGPGPTGFEFDFESVALHELGHAHLLGHVIDDNDVMDFNLGPAQDLRSLSARNIIAANIIQTNNTTNIICALPLMTNYNCATAGVEDKELANAISIYPNPTTGQFYIKNGSSLNLEKVVIYDVSGRLISNINLSNASKAKTINLSGASKGVYFVNIHSEKGMTTKKLIFE